MEIILKIFRKLYSYFASNTQDFKIDYEGQNASDQIYNLLSSNKPFLVARIGAVEFECISAFLNTNKGISKYFDYVLGRTNNLEINNNVIQQAHVNAGIFPAYKETIENFAKQALIDIEQIDILGVWLKEQHLLKETIKNRIKIPLKDIEPYYHANPWSKALTGKKVLVIHPFEESIISQYSKNDELFENPEILPNFELKTIKAVQTIAGQPSEFNTWFEALDYMKEQMDQIDYDVAIIGCGAYGLSLGAHAKRMGKQAIHMGGATQILFGIKGSRWDNHPEISKLYNNHWSRPLISETPAKKDAVEDGCYW
ncbi:hypothetical protein [Maribacter sp. MAR_2009_72]|uniref:hypothetical protein n=1 Tax=Maribacter sp. MAR_2009_72 TaxID=1250050 RepID=UPI00119BF588|nr:hypothetical protein [Maribacter sp. MAR_2009_72]TVZ13847.1 hypothetical protein JM81_0042 [Maribacter sp. MAR_2009_72]